MSLIKKDIIEMKEDKYCSTCNKIVANKDDHKGHDIKGVKKAIAEKCSDGINICKSQLRDFKVLQSKMSEEINPVIESGDLEELLDKKKEIKNLQGELIKKVGEIEETQKQLNEIMNNEEKAKKALQDNKLPSADKNLLLYEKEYGQTLTGLNTALGRLSSKFLFASYKVETAKKYHLPIKDEFSEAELVYMKEKQALGKDNKAQEKGNKELTNEDLIKQLGDHVALGYRINSEVENHTKKNTEELRKISQALNAKLNEMDTVEIELRAKKRENDDIKSKLEQLKQEYKHLNAEMTKLQEEKLINISKLKLVKDEFTMYKAENSIANNEHSRIKNELNAMKEECQETLDRLIKARSEAISYEKISEMVQKAKEELEEIRKKLEEVTTEHKGKTKIKEKLSDEIRGLENKKNMFTEDIKGLKEKQGPIEEELKKINKEIDDEKSKLQDLNKQVKETNEKLGEKKDELNSKISKEKEVTEKLMSYSDQLQKLVEGSKKIPEKIKECENVVKKMDDVKYAYKRMREKIELSRENIRKLEESKDDLEKKINELKIMNTILGLAKASSDSAKPARASVRAKVEPEEEDKMEPATKPKKNPVEKVEVKEPSPAESPFFKIRMLGTDKKTYYYAITKRTKDESNSAFIEGFFTNVSSMLKNPEGLEVDFGPAKLEIPDIRNIRNLYGLKELIFRNCIIKSGLDVLEKKENLVLEDCIEKQEHLKLIVNTIVSKTKASNKVRIISHLWNEDLLNIIRDNPVDKMTNFTIGKITKRSELDEKAKEIKEKVKYLEIEYA